MAPKKIKKVRNSNNSKRSDKAPNSDSERGNRSPNTKVASRGAKQNLKRSSERQDNAQKSPQRKAAQQHWVLGHHAINAVLTINPERAVALWVNLNPHNASQATVVEHAQQLGLPIHPLEKQALAKRVDSEYSQGVALEARPKHDGGDKELDAFVRKLDGQMPLLLILDHVQDPHNFGACLRTADAAGAHAVVVAKDNASPMTPVVQKVASGAAETMPIFRVTNIARTMQSLKEYGIWMIGTSDKATHSLFQETLTSGVAIVMGAEGKGMRQLTEKTCDSLVSLPMAGAVVSSLNVSVATGICLYEVVRQRS